MLQNLNCLPRVECVTVDKEKRSGSSLGAFFFAQKITKLIPVDLPMDNLGIYTYSVQRGGSRDDFALSSFAAV